MRKIRSFQAFGCKYRTTQFSATEGLEIMGKRGAVHPCEMLANTEIHFDGRGWLSLAEPDNINDFVSDITKILAPRLVLQGITTLVYEFNFEFINDWKGAKVPARFLSEARTISSHNIDPLCSQLMQDGAATLRELEEYYSIEDAFKMFDSIMVKGINEALAQEAITKKSSRK